MIAICVLVGAPAVCLATEANVKAAAQSMGMTLAYAPATSGTDFPGIASVKMARIPNVRLVTDFTDDLSAGEARGRLIEAKRALLAFAKSHLFAALVVSGKARAEIFVISVVGPKQPDFRAEAIHGLRYRGLNHAAACFELSHLRYYDVDVALVGKRDADWWLMLQNGDLILNQAAPGEKVPEGSILRTDGSVESPSSSLPC